MDESVSRPSACRRSISWMRWVLVFAAALAYLNCFRGVFLLDDKYTIPDNPWLNGGATAWYAPFVAPPGAPSAGRPLISLSFWLNWRISGADPWSYQAANVLIHMGVALLLFGLVRRVLARSPQWGSRADGLAFLTVLLWVVHPLHTSAVTYVSQRAESLMALFFIGCLSAVERGAARPGERRWAVLALACGYLATFAKEVGAMLPLVVLLFDRAYLSPSWREAWRRRRGFVLAMIPALLALAALQLQTPRGNTVQWSYQGINPLTYLQSQAVGLCLYLWKMVWPDPLVMHYGWPVGHPAWLWIPCFLLIATLFLGSAWAMVRRPRAGFPAVAAFVMLGPSSSVVPVISEIWAEHRMYLPGLIVLLYAVLGVAMAVRRKGWDRSPAAARLGPVALAVWLAAAVSLCWLQNARYRSEIAMWRYNALHTPGNRLAHYNLGCAYGAVHRFPEAAAAFDRSIQCSPDYGDAWGMLGVVFASMGDVSRAVECSRRAVTFERNNDLHPLNLASHLVMAGRAPEAVAVLRDGIRRASDPRQMQYALLEIFLKSGNPHQARAELAAWRAVPSNHPSVTQTLEEIARSTGLSGGPAESPANP